MNTTLRTEETVSSRTDHVQALAKGLAVIRAFSAEQPAMTLAEVARSTGITRASARRLLLTLEDLGYVRCDGRLFQLTPQLLNLGYAFVSSLGIPAVAQPFLEQLSEKLHESCSVAVLDRSDVVYVARVPAQRIMTISLALGSRLPAASTSLGRVLLSELPEQRLEELLTERPLVALTPYTITNPCQLRVELARVRKQGWALLDQELEIGVRSLSAPLRDRSGRPVAAVNASSHVGRTSKKELQDSFLPALLETAEAINRALAMR